MLNTFTAIDLHYTGISQSRAERCAEVYRCVVRIHPESQLLIPVNMDFSAEQKGLCDLLLCFRPLLVNLL